MSFSTPIKASLENRLDLNRYIVRHPSSTFFMKAKGSGSAPSDIMDEDILVVDRALSPSNNLIVAVFEGAFHLGRIKRKGGRGYFSHAGGEMLIEEDSDFKVWGAVTYVVRKL